MPDDPRADTLAPTWWRRGEDDFRAAETLLHHAESGLWTAAFHAQQAAEKFIKAYLVAHGVSVDRREFRTHEIDNLRSLVGQSDPALADTLAFADVLSEYAVESRYPPVAPGIDDEVPPQEAEEAIEIAQRVRDTLWAKLSGILR
jgi:HEPN domain-containing protein